MLAVWWLSGNGVAHINKDTVRRVGFLLRRVTVWGIPSRSNHPGQLNLTIPRWVWRQWALETVSTTAGKNKDPYVTVGRVVGTILAHYSLAC